MYNIIGNHRGRSIAGAGIALAIALALTGCGDGDTSGPDTENEIVLFGYLYVNETISEENAIFLSRTVPVLDSYDIDEAVITNAVVTLRREGIAGADTLHMVNPGYYANPDIFIDPVTTYYLSVDIEGEAPVTAATTTPWPFEVLGEPLELPGEMVYSGIADSFPILLTCEEGEQIFMVDAYCREEWQDAQYIEAFGAEDSPQDYDEYGGDNGEPRHIYPYFRVKDLEQEGGIYRIGWYVDLFVFYGEYDVHLFSVDDNFYNYLYRDHPERNGGVEGGIGVFGSACREGWRVKAIP